jgi:hypothetical protein
MRHPVAGWYFDDPHNKLPLRIVKGANIKKHYTLKSYKDKGCFVFDIDDEDLKKDLDNLHSMMTPENFQKSGRVIFNSLVEDEKVAILNAAKNKSQMKLLDAGRNQISLVDVKDPDLAERMKSVSAKLQLLLIEHLRNLDIKNLYLNGQRIKLKMQLA